MEEYVTIAEGARRLGGISDKTIRRAIHAGKLAARYPRPNKAEVSIQDLEAWHDSLRVRPGETEDRLKALEMQVTELSDRWQKTRTAVDALEALQATLKFEVITYLNKFATIIKEQSKHLEQLSTEITQLQARIQALESQKSSEPAPKAEPKAPTQPSLAPKKKPKGAENIPEGFVYLSDFAQEHFVPRRIAEGLFPHAIRGQKVKIGRLIYPMIGPKGRRDFWVQLHTHADFRSCDDCPHEENGQSV